MSEMGHELPPPLAPDAAERPLITDAKAEGARRISSRIADPPSTAQLKVFD